MTTNLKNNSKPGPMLLWNSNSSSTRIELKSLSNRLVDGLLRIPSDEVLNFGESIEPKGNPAQILNKAAKGLSAEAIDPSGEVVNYRKLSTSNAYQEFKTFTRALPNCEPWGFVERFEQLAFWVNLYNALIIDAVIYYDIQGSLLNKLSFFRRAAYNVGGFRFSADDIEHGVLRGNRPNPVLPIRPFHPTDPRLTFAISLVEPRIHFALVCGARSCPPIAFYDCSKLDQQLDIAAVSFINGGGAHYDQDRDEIQLSKIFRWYREDFGGLQGTLGLVKKYTKDAALVNALNDGRSKIRYIPYDWSVNALT